MSLTKSAPPRRKKNADVRTREHLTEAEVTRLRAAAGRTGRYGLRDALMVLMAFRHGFRAIEICSLKWNQVDLESRVLHVKRVKNGMPSTHPLSRVELAELRKLKGDHTGYVFLTERGGKLSTHNFHRIVARAGQIAAIDLVVHPHMFRHACGYHLASQGQDTRAIQAYLGHRNIQHTVRYTELAPDRFKSFFAD
jgi:integrase